MKQIATIIILGLLHTSATNGESITTPHTKPEQGDIITIYEALYGNILQMTYESLKKKTDVSNIIPVKEPGLGYQWSIGKVTCEYRIVPTTGKDLYQRWVIGYFLDFSMFGDLQTSEMLNLDKSLDHLIKKCGHIYQNMIDELERTASGIKVTQFSAVGDNDDVHWIIEKPHDDFISDFY